MKPEFDNGIGKLYHADAREIPLDDRSVHCVVTSPPYWGLRDYGLDAGIGNERTLSEHVENIVAVGREIKRVLRNDGTFWLNYGDAYASGKNLPSKNLYGLPWRIAFALQDAGWILRSAIVWNKPNPMPESVRDRPTSAYDMIFLFAKQGKYFYDGEPLRSKSARNEFHGVNPKTIANPDRNGGRGNFGAGPPHSGNTGANARNVWTINTQGRPDAHFATFPDELPRRCIVAGTSEHGVCADCGAQWERELARGRTPLKSSKHGKMSKHQDRNDSDGVEGWKTNWQPMCDCDADIQPATALDPFGSEEAERRCADCGTPWQKSVVKPGVKTLLNKGRNDGDRVGVSFVPPQNITTGWRATCDCDAEVVPATVLDPFVGSGTTVEVAQRLGRRGIGLDLNAEYLEIAKQRIGLVLL